MLEDPPLSSEASGPSRKIVSKLVQRDAKRLRRDALATVPAGEGDAGESDDGEGGHDAALHRARKSAKRLRYAAEAAVPLFGKRADRLAKAAHEIQKILGHHQDSVVTRDFLRRLGAKRRATPKTDSATAACTP